MFTLATVDYTVEIRDVKGGKVIFSCDNLNTAMVNVFKNNWFNTDNNYSNYWIAIITDGQLKYENKLNVYSESSMDGYIKYTFNLGSGIKCACWDSSHDLHWISPRRLEWMPHYIIELITS